MKKCIDQNVQTNKCGLVCKDKLDLQQSLDK